MAVNLTHLLNDKSKQSSNYGDDQTSTVCGDDDHSLSSEAAFSNAQAASPDIFSSKISGKCPNGNTAGIVNLQKIQEERALWPGATPRLNVLDIFLLWWMFLVSPAAFFTRERQNGRTQFSRHLPHFTPDNSLTEPFIKPIMHSYSVWETGHLVHVQ